MRKGLQIVLWLAAGMALLNSAAGVFVYAEIALGAQSERGPLTQGEWVDLLLLLTTFPLLFGILWCTIRPRTGSFRVALCLTVTWITVFTWRYWFGPFPATQMYDLHSSDPNEIRAEIIRHFARVTATYLFVVAQFSLLPILKVLEARRKP